jgi:DNA-binding transcriptional MerR regulator
MDGKTYRIGDAAQMLNLKSYVLRFWETEFPQLQPIRTEKGQRLYTEEHIALLRHIRTLLHERGLTIDGARKELAAQSPKNQEMGKLVAELVTELEDMKRILTQP